MVVGAPEELAEVAWRALPDLDELMPAGAFDPVAAYLKRVLS